MLESLFVYGTLKESETQKRIIGREIVGVPNTLENHAMSSLSIPNEGTFPVVIDEIGKNVQGLVLTVLTKDFVPLDKYEGPSYKRVRIILKNGMEAWIYK